MQPSAPGVPPKLAPELSTPVSEIMTREVATTRSGSRLIEAARLMRELHVSGLPVVDAADRVVGVVSEKDVVRHVHRSTGFASPRGLIDLLLGSAPHRGLSLLETCRHRLENGYVREAMTRPAITLDPMASLRQAARQMHAHHIHRIPILDRYGKLVGIVSQADLAAAFARGSPLPRRGALHPSPRGTSPRPRPTDPYADA